MLWQKKRSLNLKQVNIKKSNIDTIAHIIMNKEINELEDELRSEYDFAQMQGGVKGKYVQ
jgi:hypothetical protein